MRHRLSTIHYNKNIMFMGKSTYFFDWPFITKNISNTSKGDDFGVRSYTFL